MSEEIVEYIKHLSKLKEIKAIDWKGDGYRKEAHFSMGDGVFFTIVFVPMLKNIHTTMADE